MAFSLWAQAMPQSAEFKLLDDNKCLSNPTSEGRAIDPTTKQCRDLIWNQFLKPRYYDQGIHAYWLDQDDGAGTGGGGSGDHGYDTSYGPAPAYSNLWVNDWLATFTDPIAALDVPNEHPMVLTRGVWAGGQRHGAVLWSSDTESTFEELAAQVPLGVHASLSGIPWWTSDVGGYGCDKSHPEESAYMRELVVRWYQFGMFCPVFRTHGGRDKLHPGDHPHPDLGACKPRVRTGWEGYGPNEIWSYGNDTQAILSGLVVARHSRLKGYIAELDENVTARGVPTMRPLWWEFPSDGGSYGVNDQYMLGPRFLVAPVTQQGQKSKAVYFPPGSWRNFFTGEVVRGAGAAQAINTTSLLSFPAYERV